MRFIRFILPILLIAAFAAPALAADQRITITTGGRTGNYYWIGVDICGLLKREQSRHRIDCKVEASRGSVANLVALRSRRVDFAIVQADVLLDVKKGKPKAAEQGPAGIRGVFALHREALAILLAPGTRAETVAELKTRRLSLGGKGSGHRITAQIVFETLTGSPYAPPAGEQDIPTDRQARALCGGQVDGSLLVLGHPSDTIREITTQCFVKFLPLDYTDIAKLTQVFPLYEVGVLPPRTYPGIYDSIPRWPCRPFW